MTKLKIAFLFISLFVYRWLSYPSPLPEGWTNDSVVGYTVIVLNDPEYTDSQTIVRSGIWYIDLKGYIEIIPGSRVRFEGKVEPKMVMGKVTQVVMRGPKIEDVNKSEKGKGISEKFVRLLGQWRERWVSILQKTLPEPMASLAAGILLGVKGQMPKDFYQNLVNTGTLHIVAASGYNVTIVAAVIMKTAMMFVARGPAIGMGIIGIIIYVFISGAGASVVRAGIMGSLTLIAYYFGRPTEARRLLFVTGGIMLLINPLMLVDIGFQLSFVATAGLLYLEPTIKKIGLWLSSRAKSRDPSTAVGMTKELVGITNKVSSASQVVQAFMAEYLSPTLAATIATLPVIIYHFGRVSLVSPLVNILVLPLVPLIMGMTAAILVGGQVVAWFTYPLLLYMIWVIELFG